MQNLPTLKRRLKALRAYWCELDETIVATLKNDAALDFGVQKDILTVKMGGELGENRLHYRFSTEGLKLRDNMRKTTCAFTGKRV